MTDRRAPRGYEPPFPGTPHGTRYYLQPQSDYDGPTPLYMVMRAHDAGARILAERCLLGDGMAIVDALRLAHSLATMEIG